MKVKLVNNIADADAVLWNGLVGDAYPFLRHEFLLALEQSGAVSEQTGWLPKHLLVIDGDEWLGVMPLYLKSHSRGEYVFDSQWAQAYHQHGLAYYPKWLASIPFTPCQGPRFCAKAHVDPQELLQLMLAAIKDISGQNDISSWHCLFPDAQQLELLRSTGLHIREDVQFHWFNKGYHDFDDFLQTLNAAKRKMIRRERRKVSEQGVELLSIAGQHVSAGQWGIFFRFYAMTYLKKGSQPYLSLAFFQQLGLAMGEYILVVFAVKAGQYVGAALSFVGADTLYGRYWGCYEEYNALHFEACYYQGLDYCIAHGLKRFDSGAQGEHKIARGFEPVTTYSAHWIKDARFADAIAQFLVREQQAVQSYKADAAAYLPFKQHARDLD
ncbi:MAG: GNAT family N-acetyltransferase [Methylovulum sp.]|nr:GNAT family N-acetyltransferase [Methylovulum sp.]